MPLLCMTMALWLHAESAGDIMLALAQDEAPQAADEGPPTTQQTEADGGGAAGAHRKLIVQLRCAMAKLTSRPVPSRQRPSW